MAYTYDGDGNRASLTDPNGSVIAYSHTARGQVASIVADGPPPLAAFAYTTGAEGGSGEIPRPRDPEGDPSLRDRRSQTSGSERVNCHAAGRRTSRTLENGITSTYAYDADGQLTSLTHGSVETLTYTYDNMHRRTGEPSHLGSGAEDSQKRTRRVPMAAGSGRHQTRSSAPARTFGYDLTGQLIAVNQSSGNATFAYDAVGNRTVVTGASGAGSYTANNLNQYTTASGGALTYDANGNLASGGGVSYTHNGNSRMVSAVGPGSATASFGRDGRNRDVKRTIDGVTTYLIYDGWNLVADHRSRWRLGGDSPEANPQGRDEQERASQYNAAGTLTTQYIHGPRVDEILAKVTPTSTTFPLPDALGSTIAVTDSSGAVLERVYYFDAFGTPTFRSGTGVQLPDTSTGTRFLFTGREWFARLGLYDYRNRTYSPRLGRFVQADPIRFKARDINLYRYVGNSPANGTDPTGLIEPQGVPIWDQVAPALVGAAHMYWYGSQNPPPDDGYVHCLTQCRMAKTEVNPSKASTETLGDAHEALHPSEDEADDQKANGDGRDCAKAGKDCDCCCKDKGYKP